MVQKLLSALRPSNKDIRNVEMADDMKGRVGPAVNKMPVGAKWGSTGKLR